VEQPRLGEPLPRADEAIIDRRKLVNYALDPTHPRGRHKAVVFKAELAIDAENWRYLRDRILEALPDYPVSSIQLPDRPEKATTFGVVIPVTGLNGRVALVISAWRLADGRPHLTAARVAKKRVQTADDRSTL
jgi:hypothetical protein